MQDKNNFTIGVLSITATVLLVGVILTTLGGQNTPSSDRSRRSRWLTSRRFAT